METSCQRIYIFIFHAHHKNVHISSQMMQVMQHICKKTNENNSPLHYWLLKPTPGKQAKDPRGFLTLPWWPVPDGNEVSGQAKDLFGSTCIYKHWSISHNLIQTTLRWWSECYWHSSVCALTHAHILAAPIWLQVRASTHALNQPGTEQEGFGFTFTILPGRRLLYFPSFFLPGKVHLP